MHIHGMNPNIESNAVYAAQRAEARQEAEAFKKKLAESVARLVADAEDCVVNIGAQEDNAKDQAKQNNQQEKKQKKEDAKQNDVSSRHISDWA
jgi:predicted NBD/HSP70 family sugar kinase